MKHRCVALLYNCNFKEQHCAISKTKQMKTLMKKMVVTVLILLFILSLALAGFGQQTVSYNLAELLKREQLRMHNKTIKALDEKAVYITEDTTDGIAWIKDIQFTKGRIDVDLKGRDVLQRSFIGIAFHGVNDSTYDAVYFRPFNFKAKDSVRHIHAVQYISEPQYTWSRLREERNAQFEKAIADPPDPDTWFHATIVVDDTDVYVYVNNKTEPSLHVKMLNNRKTGWIGLWTGFGADGSFSNLVIQNL